MADEVPKEVVKRLKKMGLPTPEKARKILDDGEVNGKPLTDAQKRLFGMIASGKVPTKLSEMSKDQRAKAAAA